MTEQKTKYYVIATEYIWRDFHGPLPKDKVDIKTTPAREDHTEEVVFRGYVGKRPEFSYTEVIFAYGEYETIEEARGAVTEIFGVVRDRETFYHEQKFGVVESYFIGEYETLTPDESIRIVDRALRDQGIEFPHTEDSRISEKICKIAHAYQVKHKKIVDQVACHDFMEHARICREISDEEIRREKLDQENRPSLVNPIMNPINR